MPLGAKVLIGFVCVALAVTAIYTTINRKPVVMDFRTQTTVPELVSVSTQEVVIQYANIKGRPLQLVYEPSKERVILRIKVKGHEQLLCAGEEHDFLLQKLREEVVRLTTGHQLVVLGNTGYTFTYEGGYPIWGPHGEGAVDEYQCLLFAQNAKLVGNEIRASGTPTVEGWDGYKLWQPRPYKEAVVIYRSAP